MARATTKADLVTSANGQFEKMWKLIDTMSDEQQNATFGKEMATAGKEAHWSRDKTCVTYSYTSTNGICCC